MAISSVTAFIMQFVEPMSVRQGETFTIGDYGANDGSASRDLMTEMIGHLRKKHGEALPIQVIYEDQEKNDFSSLFRWLQDESSYMSKFSNVYPFATNINFYERCVPDGTCDIIFCSMSTHWLQRVDTQFKNTYFHMLASEEEQRSFSLEADRDWTKFLRLRAKELKPGGLLIIVNITGGHSDTQQSADSLRDATQGGTRIRADGVTGPDPSSLGFMLQLHYAWTDLRNDSVITQTEFENCIMKACYRTEEEITAPFMKSSSMKEAGLTFVMYKPFWFKSAALTQWKEKLEKEGVDDRDFYAHMAVSAMRVWTQSSFENSLSHMRSANEKAAILDLLFKSAEKRVAERVPQSLEHASKSFSVIVARKEQD